MKDLISVIIPIFNTETYLSECLESAVHQTYTNLEIILINDGSTDNSYDICENYAKRDSRIKLINKHNEGIAKTRNLGIDRAKGEYIYFIDSDDYIELDTIEKLYSKIQTENADLCITGCIQEYEDGGIITYDLNGFDKYSKNESLEALCLNKELHSYLWGCLIHKDLLKNIRFIPGKNYEDLAMVYKLYILAEKIVFVCAPLCHYRIRTGSITSYKSPNELIIVFEILKERNDFVIAYEKGLADACFYSTYLCIIDLLYRIFQESKNKYKKEYEELISYLKYHKHDFLNNKYLNNKEKILLLIVLCIPQLYFYIHHFIAKG